jgi:hypothetical protein
MLAPSSGSSSSCSDCQTPKLEPAYFSKTWVTIQQLTWLNVTEGLDLHHHSFNNLKSHSQVSAILTYNKTHFIEGHRWIHKQQVKPAVCRPFTLTSPATFKHIVFTWPDWNNILQSGNEKNIATYTGSPHYLWPIGTKNMPLKVNLL